MSLIALASGPTIRKRVFRRFALDQQNINGLADEIATLRQQAYENRLAQFAAAMGVPTDGALTDEAVLTALQRESRDVAFGVVRTHNQALRDFLAQQPAGLSQRELAQAVGDWETQRQATQSALIARNEGYTASNRADADVMRRNNLDVPCAVIPDTAECEDCVEVVDRGWIRPDDVDFSLPVHVSCQHEFTYKEPLDDAIVGKAQVWLGDWIDMADTRLDATDPDNDNDIDLPGQDTDGDVTQNFGYFLPRVLITRSTLRGGVVHGVRYKSDRTHLGTIISRDDETHTAVLWNGRVSEHDTLDGAVGHVAVSHGIRREASAIEGV